MIFSNVLQRSLPARRLLTAAAGGLLLFGLALAWPSLAQGMSAPSIQTLTVVSDKSTYFHSDALPPGGGTVYFNNVAGQGQGQIISVRVTSSDTITKFEGGTAFGMAPAPALAESGGMWVVSYTVGAGLDSYPGVVFTLTDAAGMTTTTVISFVLDVDGPVVTFTDVTDPDYDPNGNELDADGSNWYKTGNLTGGWTFTTTSNHTPDELVAGSCAWDHQLDANDQVLDCGVDGDGTFLNVADDDDGLVTVTVTLTDRVGNAGSAAVNFHLDGSPPAVSNAHITESKSQLYAAGTTLYYADIPGIGEPFAVEGTAGDGSGVGLSVATFSPAFGVTPNPDATPAQWSGSYLANNSGGASGQITVTVSDLVSNTVVQAFDYVQDTEIPASSINSAQIVGNQISLPWTASDGGGSGLERTELWSRRNSGGSWAVVPGSGQAGTSGTFLFTPGQDGTYFFGSKAVDRVGNQQANPGGAGQQMVIFDTISPTLSSIQLVESSEYLYLDNQILYYSDAIIGSADFTISGLAADDPASEAELDFVAYADVFNSSAPLVENLSGYAAGWSHTYAVDNTHSGNGVITATVYDGAGNTATISYTYAQDSASPTDLTISVAANNSSGTSFEVSWSATDPAPSAGLRDYEVQYRVDQGSWKTWFASTTAKTATFGPASPEVVDLGKTYQFRVRARDNVGHQSAFSESPAFSPPLATVFLPFVTKALNVSAWDQFYEENDTQADAFGPLQSGQTYLAYPDDLEDFYFFTVNNTALVQISLANYLVSEGDLLLYRDNGDGSRTFIANVGFYNPTMSLTVGSLSPGKYLVRVRTTMGASTANLYQLAVTIQEASGSWNQFLEENDNQLIAFGPLQSGQTYLAYPDDEDDFYTFTLSQAGNVSILLTNYLVGEGDLILYRDDGNGSRTVIKNVGFYSPTMSLNESLAAGTYLVRVRTTNGTSTADLYNLTVTY
ncbi:MAG: hypothetical protein ACE5H9_07680 [Anaerolineae bacterium]